ncbi:hypothetical protein ACFXD5_11770 [Streptomyces sp. NPDC059385]|uniref:hypothetical protein n=1 Tax=Streptomyces sp. NPDC059385 TaxID=3346817 RepID=UPI0036D091D1
MLTIPANLKSRSREQLWAWYEEVVRTPGRPFEEKDQAYGAVCAALPKPPPLPPGALPCGHMEPEECDIDCHI